MTLSVKGLSLSAGILWGAAVFVITIATLLRGNPGQHVGLLAGVYPGYTVSYLGSIVGFVYGFVSAAVLGWLLAWLYNKIGKQS
jgi:hypothetical protein